MRLNLDDLACHAFFAQQDETWLVCVLVVLGALQDTPCSSNPAQEAALQTLFGALKKLDRYLASSSRVVEVRAGRHVGPCCCSTATVHVTVTAW
jgi:hypothetical protein